MFRQYFKNYSNDNIKKTGLTGYVCDFSADYNAIPIDDIKDIHKYLIQLSQKQ